MRSHLLAICTLAACASPSAVELDLSPSLISSLAGTTDVTALVVDEHATPISGKAVHVAVTYTDRNGASHDVSVPDGKTDDRGVFHATLSGLTWEGTGTVAVSTSTTVTASATFAVLDRTPPKVTILPPTSDLHAGAGLPLLVQVHVTDEIGVAQLSFATDAAGNGGTTTRLLASGTTDTMLTFQIDVPQNAAGGSTFQLFALAQDLSGNRAAATPVTITIDPNITIATPPPLSGSLLVDGTANQLANPRGIVYSPKDGHLYISDQAGTGACSPSCIWRVDATNGAIDSTPVLVGSGAIEGLALDATGDNLYYSDRQNRTGRLTWNGTAYAGNTVCNNVGTQSPADPFHLVFDTTLGLLVVDGNAKEVVRIASCATTTAGTQLTNGNFDQPRGIAAGAAGEFYVSDQNRDEVFTMTSAGALTPFERGIGAPYGMRWLGAGTTQFANSLMVASGDRMVESTKGAGPAAAAYLRNVPIDLTFATGTMYVVTSPSANNRGRLYRVTGF